MSTNLRSVIAQVHRSSRLTRPRRNFSSSPLEPKETGVSWFSRTLATAVGFGIGELYFRNWRLETYKIYDEYDQLFDELLDQSEKSWSHPSAAEGLKARVALVSDRTY